MKLYVMRHGPAEDHAATGRDFDRALTSSGRDRVRSVAKELLSASEAPLVVITSPLVRAQETADLVATVTGLEARGGRQETREELAPEGEAHALVRRLVGHADQVMVVGHEPDVSGLSASLLGGRLPTPFDKAMVVGLELPKTGVATLRFVLDPKRLVWDPDHRDSFR